MTPTLMALPWRSRAANNRAESNRGDRHLVFASRFDATGSRSALTLFRRSAAVYLAAAKAPGCRGASMVARPLKRAYYTASVWDDEASLNAFARSAAHHQAVIALRAVGEVDGVLMSWWTQQPGRPKWAEIFSRTAAHRKGSYEGPETSEEYSNGASLTA